MVTAALLTGLVVLLFLGSARSTLIVATSIPLVDLVLDPGARLVRSDDQCHDAGRAGAGGRHSGR